jgi:hypothetical protein
MPRTLNTLGNTTLSIAICDRCKMKRAYDDLGPDPNFPGLRVCGQGCRDQRDPYRQPARQPEKIALRFPRPDADIAVYPHQLQTGPYGVFTVSTEQNTQTPENDGNVDGITAEP